MAMRPLVLILGSLFIGICLLIPTKTISCPIPVFRYALEFWETDPYIVDIYYQQPFDPDHQKLVNHLIMASKGENLKANLEVRTIDLNEEITSDELEVINQIPSNDLPYMVLRHPKISGINRFIWSGPLSAAGIDLMLTSPARESVSHKLVDDASAVWVLLESGNRQKDREALTILNDELRRLEQTLVLPELDLWLDNSHLENYSESLKIKFETIRVSRHDPREEYFVKMLMSSEDDLHDFVSEPIVFPFYGRGRALWAIVGGGINHWNIREAAEFLTGPCSCQAKLLNPGVDMLMTMDWDHAVDNIADVSIANPLSGLGDFSKRETKVTRLLDEATRKLMGSSTRQNEGLDRDTKEVVFHDPYKERKKKVQQAPAKENIDESGKHLNGLTKPHPTAEASPSLEKKHPNAAIDQPSKKMGIISLMVLIIAGLVVVILALGVVFYWKRID